MTTALIGWLISAMDADSRSGVASGELEWRLSVDPVAVTVLVAFTAQGMANPSPN